MRSHLLFFLLALLHLVPRTTAADSLYRYDFDNGTSGTWAPDTAWTICRSVSTGTPEYCQRDSTETLATAAFDGNLAWSDYSVEADVKLNNYLSGEIGIIGRAQDASNYYRLSLKSHPTTGARMWWLSRIDGGVATLLASGRQYFQSGYYYRLKLTFFKDHIEGSISHDGGVTFDTMGFVDDARYRTGKIGLMTSNTQGVFDNVAVNTLAAPNTRRFGRVVFMTLENQNYADIIGNPNMPYLNSLVERGALLTNFYANFHPSQPDYFALTTGQSFYTKEGPLPPGTKTVASALATKNKTWKGYYTDLTTHEAVFRYFPEVWQNPTELARIVPIFPDFMRDVTTGALPAYSMIHDLPTINGHDCTDAGLCMGPVDDRLRETIEPYLNHPSFIANDDLLVVLFDEAKLTDNTCSGGTTIPLTEAARLRGGWTCGGRTVAIFLGAGVKRGYKSTTLYHHEAFLRLALEGLGVTDALPGASAFAPNMNELFEDVSPPPPPPPVSVLPAGWQTHDIGAVGVTGNASFSSGTYTVTGAGADIWGASDALRFAYTTLNGDGRITARVVSEQYVHAWTKAGVMIRDSAAPGSRQALMLVSPGKGNAFQRRLATNGASSHTAGAFVSAPYWVRLARAGNTITASESADGTTWTIVGTDTIAFAPSVAIGLAVSSHSFSAAATATFDNVLVEPLWASEDIGAVGAAGSTSIANGVFTLAGAGADIWGTADAFRFTYQRLTGDGEIVARVADLSGTHAWHKVGVMIRHDLTPGSAHGLMLVSSGKGLAFQRRVGVNGVSIHTAGPLVAAPRWVKLARAGDVITASWSNDGTVWTVVGSDTIPMQATVYIGLANSSHVAGTLGTATVDGVKRQP